MDWLQDVFATKNFMPHGHCILWKPDLLWLRVGSDAVIALSYYSIPLAIMYFIRRRRDVIYAWIPRLFAAFILACGTTHIMSIWTIWDPQYWVDAFVRLGTAGISLITAVALWPLMPALLKIPNPKDLEAANRELADLNRELERRVTERTAQLEATALDLEQRAAELEEKTHLLEREAAHHKATKEELDQFFQLSLDFLCIAHTDGHFLKLNPAFQDCLGFPLKSLENRHFLELVHPDDVESTAEAFASNIGGTATHYFEVRMLTVSGGYRWLRWASRPVAETKRLYASGQDITGLKHTQQRLQGTLRELRRSNEELQSFAYSASHDLREPLRKIRLFSDTLLREWGQTLGERGTDYLRRMGTAAERMTRLIDDLLVLSRISTRAKTFEPADLNTTLGAVMDDLTVQVQETGARVHLPQHLPTIEGDATQIHQLLQNLLSNALKFHLPGVPPEVHVHVEDLPRGIPGEGIAEPAVRLSVQDNGTGFDPRQAGRLFAIFQRLHHREDYEGTGVGLAMCKKIVDRHRGLIHADAMPGKGATFTVVLPVHQPPVHEPEEAEEEE